MTYRKYEAEGVHEPSGDLLRRKNELARLRRVFERDRAAFLEGRGGVVGVISYGLMTLFDYVFCACARGDVIIAEQCDLFEMRSLRREGF